MLDWKQVAAKTGHRHIFMDKYGPLYSDHVEWACLAADAKKVTDAAGEYAICNTEQEVC